MKGPVGQVEVAVLVSQEHGREGRESDQVVQHYAGVGIVRPGKPELIFQTLVQNMTKQIRRSELPLVSVETKQNYIARTKLRLQEVFFPRKVSRLIRWYGKLWNLKF